MGLIRIERLGSFPYENTTFSAMKSGHAVAVDDAIRWLQDRLKDAQEQDLALRQEGEAPEDGWAEADRRLFVAMPAKDQAARDAAGRCLVDKKSEEPDTK